MIISLSAFAPENLVSRGGFGSLIPRQPAHLHTQEEYGAYYLLTGFLSSSAAASIYLLFKTAIRHRFSPESIGSRNCVPMAFTAESPPTQTGPVNLKAVVPNDECCLGRSPYGPIICGCVLSSHLFWTSGLWTYRPASHRISHPSSFRGA